MSTRTDEYWEERLAEQEAESERELEKLQVKLDKAREALEPFAAVGVIRVGSIPPSEIYLWRRTDSGNPNPLGISAADIDRAIAALEL